VRGLDACLSRFDNGRLQSPLSRAPFPHRRKWRITLSMVNRLVTFSGRLLGAGFCTALPPRALGRYYFSSSTIARYWYFCESGNSLEARLGVRSDLRGHTVTIRPCTLSTVNSVSLPGWCMIPSSVIQYSVWFILNYPPSRLRYTGCPGVLGSLALNVPVGMERSKQTGRAQRIATHDLRCDTILGVDALYSREPSPRLLVAAWGVLFLDGSIPQKNCAS
jgi:hypothetical protein